MNRRKRVSRSPGSPMRRSTSQSHPSSSEFGMKVDRWEEETKPEAYVTIAETAPKTRLCCGGGMGDLGPDGNGVPFCPNPDCAELWGQPVEREGPGPRCEICGRGVRDGLVVCGGLSPCLKKYWEGK